MRNLGLPSVIALLLVITSCSVDRIGNMVEKADAKRTLARNEAIGGLDYQPKNGAHWDSHFTTCRTDQAGALVFGSSGSDDVLKVSSNGAASYAIVNAPDGPVRFDKTACDTFQIKPASSGEPASETLICSKDGATLNTTVRFGTCSH